MIPVSRCACGASHMPPEPVCTRCGTATKVMEVGGRGVVSSWTEVHVAPEGHTAPYVLLMVRLEEGGKVLARAEGEGSGTEWGGRMVELEFRDGIYRTKPGGG